MDSSSDEDISSDSGDEQRICASEEAIFRFDPNFNVKKWDKLSLRKRKLISGILQLKGEWTESKSLAKSNRTLFVDRQHFLTSCRGMYSALFSPRQSFAKQDDSLCKFVEFYRASQYYQFSRVVPKLFSVAAVQKYASNYHTGCYPFYNQLCTYIYIYIYRPRL